MLIASPRKFKNIEKISQSAAINPNLTTPMACARIVTMPKVGLRRPLDVSTPTAFCMPRLCVRIAI